MRSYQANFLFPSLLSDSLQVSPEYKQNSRNSADYNTNPTINRHLTGYNVYIKTEFYFYKMENTVSFVVYNFGWDQKNDNNEQNSLSPKSLTCT